VIVSVDGDGHGDAAVGAEKLSIPRTRRVV
jgi:hypothetical protein